MSKATDNDPISACYAGNTGGAQHEGCVYDGCRCPCHSVIEDAQVAVMVRTLDSWFLLNPILAHDAVVAWLESIEAPCDCEKQESPVMVDNILEATEIE